MEITGEVQAVRNDKKGLEIENIWYNSFNQLDVQKGDEVKLEYTIKGKFKNIKKLTKIVHPALQKSNEFDNLVKFKELDSTSKNMIVMTAKELYLNDKTKTLEEWIKEVKKLREMI